MFKSDTVLVSMAAMVMAMDIYVKIVYIDNDPEVSMIHNYDMCTVDSFSALKSYNMMSMVLMAIEIGIFLCNVIIYLVSCCPKQTHDDDADDDDINVKNPCFFYMTAICIVIHTIAGIVYMAMNRENYDDNDSYKCYTKAAKVHYEYLCYKIPIPFVVPFILAFLNMCVGKLNIKLINLRQKLFPTIPDVNTSHNVLPTGQCIIRVYPVQPKDDDTTSESGSTTSDSRSIGNVSIQSDPPPYSESLSPPLYDAAESKV